MNKSFRFVLLAGAASFIAHRAYRMCKDYKDGLRAAMESDIRYVSNRLFADRVSREELRHIQEQSYRDGIDRSR